VNSSAQLSCNLFIRYLSSYIIDKMPNIENCNQLTQGRLEDVFPFKSAIGTPQHKNNQIIMFITTKKLCTPEKTSRNSWGLVVFPSSDGSEPIKSSTNQSIHSSVQFQGGQQTCTLLKKSIGTERLTPRLFKCCKSVSESVVGAEPSPKNNMSQYSQLTPIGMNPNVLVVGNILSAKRGTLRCLDCRNCKSKVFFLHYKLTGSACLLR
jgi:hypothetical protein